MTSSAKACRRSTSRRGCHAQGLQSAAARSEAVLMPITVVGSPLIGRAFMRPTVSMPGTAHAAVNGGSHVRSSCPKRPVCAGGVGPFDRRVACGATKGRSFTQGLYTPLNPLSRPRLHPERLPTGHKHPARSGTAEDPRGRRRRRVPAGTLRRGQGRAHAATAGGRHERAAQARREGEPGPLAGTRRCFGARRGVAQVRAAATAFTEERRE